MLLGIFRVNVADNVLHFASAVVLLAVGLGAHRAAKTVTAEPHELVPAGHQH